MKRYLRMDEYISIANIVLSGFLFIVLLVSMYYFMRICQSQRNYLKNSNSSCSCKLLMTDIVRDIAHLKAQVSYLERDSSLRGVYNIESPSVIRPEKQRKKPGPKPK